MNCCDQGNICRGDNTGTEVVVCLNLQLSITNMDTQIPRYRMNKVMIHFKFKFDIGSL